MHTYLQINLPKNYDRNSKSIIAVKKQQIIWQNRKKTVFLQHKTEVS